MGQLVAPPTLNILTHSEEGEALVDLVWVLREALLGQRDDVTLTAREDKPRTLTQVEREKYTWEGQEAGHVGGHKREESNKEGAPRDSSLPPSPTKFTLPFNFGRKLSLSLLLFFVLLQNQV